MLELAKRIGRQRAHDVVYDAAQATVTERRAFQELLGEDERVRAHVTTAQMSELLDPARYIGLCEQFAVDGATRARRTVAELERAGFAALPLPE